LFQSTAVSFFLQLSFAPTILISPELLLTQEWTLFGSPPWANAPAAEHAAITVSEATASAKRRTRESPAAVIGSPSLPARLPYAPNTHSLGGFQRASILSGKIKGFVSRAFEERTMTAGEAVTR